MTIKSIYDAYVTGLVSANQKSCRDTIHDALKAGITLEAIYENVFYPAMVEIGYLWETNRISVAQEHLATAITQQVMAGLYDRIFDQKQRISPCKVIVTCPSQETHELASRMFADLLVLQGADVIYLGANVPIEDLVTMTLAEKPKYIGLSCTIENHLDHTEQLILALQKASAQTQIIIGGRAFDKHHKTYSHHANVTYSNSFRAGLKAMQLVRG